MNNLRSDDATNRLVVISQIIIHGFYNFDLPGPLKLFNFDFLIFIFIADEQCS